MKTRKRTQAAFAQPEISWSRKRSLRIVIRIQIQITKKKTSKATRSASPNSMSAKNKAGPFGGLAAQTRSTAQRYAAAAGLTRPQPTTILPNISGWIVQW